MHIVIFHIIGLVMAVVSTTAISVNAQELLPLTISYSLQQDINSLRRKELSYDSSRQKEVDDFAVKYLCKSYRHSTAGNFQGENICRSEDVSDVFEMWSLSPVHLKNMKGKFRSMCARYVKYNDKIYAVVRFYE